MGSARFEAWEGEIREKPLDLTPHGPEFSVKGDCDCESAGSALCIVSREYRPQNVQRLEPFVHQMSQVLV